MEGILSKPFSQYKSGATFPAILRPCNLRVWFCLLIAIAIVSQLLWRFNDEVADVLQHPFDELTANSTLGFGIIYAVSRTNSKRQQSLLRAASLTSLNITIPLQPKWTERDLTNLRAAENSALDRGSAFAWLGHRYVLQKFLKSQHHTALIMEDDVDWDTRLRTEQIPRVAYAVRKWSSSKGSHYYGDPASWDVLWLGHCGDYFSASRGSRIDSIKSFKDPVMPKFEELHPWTKNFLADIGANSDQQRLVHQSVNPLCTFAYAVTRNGAEKIVNDLAAKEPSRHEDHPCKAYDVRLLEGCRDEGLRCITVNPELFHHSNFHSEIAHVTQDSSSEDISSQAKAPDEIPTANIRCSARSGKWKELRDSLADISSDTDALLRRSAESPSDCYIDYI